MEATINGKPARLAFDTGSSHLILFPKGVARHGLSFTNAAKDVALLPGEVPVGRTEEVDLQIGSSFIKTSFRVVEIPTVLPLDADGVVGWDPLSENILWIDAGQGIVNVLTNLPSDVMNWTRFKLHTNSAVLRMEVRNRQGDPSTILVDTGSEDGAMLSPDQWRDWKASHTNPPMTLDLSYSPGAGFVVAEVAWAKKLMLGPLLMKDVPVTEGNKKELIFGSTVYQAVLGLAALKRTDVVIDGKSGFVYFRPKETPPPVYEHNRAGAVFGPFNMESGDLIAHVLKGSPAWEAGIRSGDLLTRIGELDVTRWRTDPAVLPLHRFWSRPAGTRLELTLKRGQEIFQANVLLRQILSPERGSSVNLLHE